jgi:xylulokinase
MKYFLAFDVGTTAMKCILYDREFNEIFESNEEYSLSTPENNRVELLADTYFDVFCKNVNKYKIVEECQEQSQNQEK